MKHRGLIIALLVIAAIIMGSIIALSAYKVGTELVDYHESEVAYKEYSDSFVSTVENDGPEELSPISINFDDLFEVCDDVVGWIYSDGTVINYPVVQAADNDYYLRRTMNGDYNAAGTLFLDAGCNSDFSSSNNIIYGHHMANGSMFQSITGYKKQEYYAEHPVLYLNTPEQNYRVDVFSCYVTDPGSDSYTIGFPDIYSYADWLGAIQRQSVIETDVVVDTDARILTLSTCSYEHEDARTVVHGVLVPIG